MIVKGFTTELSYMKLNDSTAPTKRKKVVTIPIQRMLVVLEPLNYCMLVKRFQHYATVANGV